MTALQITLILLAFFVSIGFTAWAMARDTLARDEYRATQMTPVVPVEEPPPSHPAPEVERHISWTLDTDEFEALHYDLLAEERHYQQARVWLDEILVDVRDELVVTA